jgi:hypothetical protein
MAPGEPIYIRRKADKLRIAGWINVPVTGVVAYFCPETVAAIIAGSLWVLAFFGVTHGIAWQMDKKANRLRQR